MKKLEEELDMVDKKKQEVLMQRQLELEQEGVKLGIARYKKAVENTPVSDMAPGVALMNKSIEPMVTALKKFKEPSRGAARLQEAKRFMLMIDDYDIAYITAKVLLNAISETKNLQTISDELGLELLTHLEYTKFRESEHKHLLKSVEKRMNGATRNAKQRRTTIMHVKRDKGIEDTPATKEERINLGIKCIEMFIETTGLVERVQTAKGQYTIQGTAEAVLWIQQAHARCELLSPVFMPMLVPPKDWDSIYGGGFLTNEITRKFKLIKTYSREALDLLRDHKMPEVYNAVNSLQKTAWRVNREVLEVLKDAWQVDSGIGGLITDEEIPLPMKLWTDDDSFNKLKEEDPSKIRQWKIKATEVYTERVCNKSKRFGIAKKIWVADKFADEEAIYFVWTLDWRGRLYPVQSFVTPQADDLGKSLLKFAEGKELGERGLYWLKVHLANKFGADKVSFDDRVKWVDDNESLIIDSASNPLDGERLWESADDPWQFLAACMEYKGYTEVGLSFVSHLPIAMDGSCNGLQNFSAMLLDEVGGSAVNLVPKETPADVYQEVVNVVNDKLKVEAERGNEYAKAWLGKVDRSLAKRNVMTVPYGVSMFGMKEQLKTEIGKRGSDFLPENVDEWKSIHYLSLVMYESIGEVVIAARQAMTWLQGVAHVVSQTGKAFSWTTPAGFLVHQHYKKQKVKQINTYWGEARLRVKLGIVEDIAFLDKAKQKMGISPNFVHSMDASHLMITINKCAKEGLSNLACIHDSYGTHAADTDRLMSLLREAFIEQYTQDVLELFKDEVIKQLEGAEELLKELPEMPKKGKLQLEDVRESLYFFA